MNDADIEELKRLRAENARQRALLARYEVVFDKSGISCRKQQLSLEDKVALFRNLFQQREDVFARRWFSVSTGKSGYQPMCSRMWNREYCSKNKYKCVDCPNREFKSLDNDDIYHHLEEKSENGCDVVGLYAILPYNTSRFLCCDFDDKNCEHGYKNDVLAYIGVCHDWGIPAYIERSRSGNGAHVWILFDAPTKAQIVRILGNAILTEAMAREGLMSIKSYNRFFSNQDFLPSGGFGNLVALPLQGRARKEGNSVFVDNNFVPFVDQWAYLQEMKKMTSFEVNCLVAKYGNNSLGELSKTSESKPWERPIAQHMSKSDFPNNISTQTKLDSHTARHRTPHTSIIVRCQHNNSNQ